MQRDNVAATAVFVPHKRMPASLTVPRKCSKLHTPRGGGRASLTYSENNWTMSRWWRRPGRATLQSRRGGPLRHGGRCPSTLNQEAPYDPGFMKPHAVPILAQLQPLFLEAHGTGRKRVTVMTPRGEERETETHDLRQFLGHTTQLQSFHLDFISYSNLHDGFFEWLAAPARLEPLGAGPQLRPPPPVSRLQPSLPALNMLSEKGFRADHDISSAESLSYAAGTGSFGCRV